MYDTSAVNLPPLFHLGHSNIYIRNSQFGFHLGGEQATASMPEAPCPGIPPSRGSSSRIGAQRQSRHRGRKRASQPLLLLSNEDVREQETAVVWLGKCWHATRRPFSSTKNQSSSADKNYLSQQSQIVTDTYHQASFTEEKTSTKHQQTHPWKQRPFGCQSWLCCRFWRYLLQLQPCQHP